MLSSAFLRMNLWCKLGTSALQILVRPSHLNKQAAEKHRKREPIPRTLQVGLVHYVYASRIHTDLPTTSLVTHCNVCKDLDDGIRDASRQLNAPRKTAVSHTLFQDPKNIPHLKSE
jgi:hypothetical protein